jgi:hypothetical protein
MLPFFLLLLCLQVRANTEIINFQLRDLSFLERYPSHTSEASEGTQVPLTVLPTASQTTLRRACEEFVNLTCPYEQWLSFELDEPHYSSYTLRISWPAFHPADFLIRAYKGLPASQPSHEKKAWTADIPMRVYAHVTAVSTGVRPDCGSCVPGPVPFHLILEPLVLGMIPASLVPLVAFLAVIGLLAWIAFRYIWVHIKGVGTEAKQELAMMARGKTE